MLLFLSACVTLFGTFICIALAFKSLTAPKKVSLVDRVKTVTGDGQSENDTIRDREKMQKSFFERTLIPLASKYSRYFGSITPSKMIANADRNLAAAGMQTNLSGLQLVSISWILMMCLPLFLGIIFLPHLAQGNISFGTYAFIVGFSAFLGYRLPVGVVSGKAKKRKHEIQLALPFSFDLISIAVSAGMSFDGAMSMVSDRTKGALSEEFKRTLREINLGITREQALSNLSTRTGVDDLRTFITAINYISKLGGNLTDVIAVQTDALRVKRQQRAEEKANQAPVKIMIPLVLFILPCVFIVILGPAVIMLVTKGPGG